ncbi:hypothetical protein O6H91_11G085800 [Diphasiastrum complanatum]|uniref:Uncharacterized protein n=2 Tax=Diphasiastrum complanatum TaxID=34168 RepID=A0ACC2CBC0_DIPCM|nr:hypothetical protein O6H91_11G073900 [Diphasiastrum complanatum]KAJ7539298.1 hypothetical protein O6H91_11G085800 [Diphasiastrum complanatum]
MGTNEERLFARKDLLKGARVLPESPNRGQEEGSLLGLSSLGELQLEQRWLIDPAQLFVGSKIGEGAHGKVYEGKYRDRSVAVKIIRTGETPEEMTKARSKFAREVAMLSKVQHKNLVKFIGACEEPMALVTELLTGQSLRKYLLKLRPKRLDTPCAVSFAIDIAQAMDCLHANGIIHRDLKPDNLLLTGDHKTVKLVDFGLAREETLTEMMTAETGTYRWMAPELYSTVTLRHGEKKHYNQKVDVYSFAIVLWELLTNRMPFEGMSNLQAAYAAAFKNVRPTVVAEDIPEELVFILQCCWADDPSVRPNFAQVVRMLTAHLSSLPTPQQTPPEQIVAIRTPTKASPKANIKGSPSSSSAKNTPIVVDSNSNTSLEAKQNTLFQCLGQCFL